MRFFWWLVTYLLLPPKSQQHVTGNNRLILVISAIFFLMKRLILIISCMNSNKDLSYLFFDTFKFLDFQLCTFSYRSKAGTCTIKTQKTLNPHKSKSFNRKFENQTDDIETNSIFKKTPNILTHNYKLKTINEPRTLNRHWIKEGYIELFLNNF